VIRVSSRGPRGYCEHKKNLSKKGGGEEKVLSHLEERGKTGGGRGQSKAWSRELSVITGKKETAIAYSYHWRRRGGDAQKKCKVRPLNMIT